MQCDSITMVMKMKSNFRIGKRVRELRAERGFSQEQLALEAEITAAYLSQIERDERNPTVRMIAKLCAVLDVSLSEFFAPEEYEREPVDPICTQIVHRLKGCSEEEKTAVLELIEQVFRIQQMR